jgi:leukotriene-A4 hydrolase
VTPARQALAPPFESGDPDDFQATIHYHKGRLLLEYLEDAFGRDAFDMFLDSYFDEFAFGTITSEQFVDYLDENLLQVHKGKVNRKQVEVWLYEPGLPADAPTASSANLEKAAAMALAWSQGEVPVDDLPTEDWSPQAVVHFINSLPVGLSDDQLGQLDATLGFSDTRNSEIGNAWFVQVAKRQHRAAYDKLEQHLNLYGRLKFIKPVYEALAANGTDMELAREMYSRARENYHPIAVRSVAKILQLESE